MNGLQSLAPRRGSSPLVIVPNARHNTDTDAQEMREVIPVTALRQLMAIGNSIVAPVLRIAPDDHSGANERLERKRKEPVDHTDGSAERTDIALRAPDAEHGCEQPLRTNSRTKLTFDISFSSRQTYLSAQLRDQDELFILSSTDRSKASLRENRRVMNSREIRGLLQLNNHHLPINLSRVDLTRLDLSGLDLTDANLTQANLTETTLDRASLRGANLTGAKMERAKLVAADLSDACLLKATMA